MTEAGVRLDWLGLCRKAHVFRALELMCGTTAWGGKRTVALSVDQIRTIPHRVIQCCGKTFAPTFGGTTKNAIFR